jgi:hypothetical protein
MGIFRRLTQSDSSQVYPFVFKITTTAANTQFTVPLVDYNGLTPNLTINWGDGNTSAQITSSSSVDRIHSYSIAGTYTITINGFMPGFKVNNTAAIRTLITELVQWGIVGLRTIDFSGCTNLTSIPGSGTLSGVGGYTGLSEVVNFTSTFQNTGITSIPSDLFNYSPNATLFASTFYGTPITTIPNGLFDNVPLANSFNSCFFTCASLTSVPSNLFDKCINVVNFSSTFRNCRALTNVLQFSYNNSVNTFANIYNMSSTSNALTGTAPTLWTRNPTPTGTAAFKNCTGLTNYASIPLNFK